MNLHKITIREIEIAKYLIQGYNNVSIGNKLNLAQSTVKIHIINLLNKIGAVNRTHAAYMIGANPELNSIIFQSGKSD